MNKLCILLAGILLVSGLSFAGPLITDRSLYIQFTANNCKASYVQSLLSDAADYADSGGDTDLYDSLIATYDTLGAEKDDLLDYATTEDREAFASEVILMKMDMALGLGQYKAARATAITEGWTNRATARSNEYGNRLDYWACTTGIMLA